MANNCFMPFSIGRQKVKLSNSCEVALADSSPAEWGEGRYLEWKLPRKSCVPINLIASLCALRDGQCVAF